MIGVHVQHIHRVDGSQLAGMGGNLHHPAFACSHVVPAGTINSRKELAQLVVNLYFALSARYGVEGSDLLSGSSGFPAFTAEVHACG